MPDSTIFEGCALVISLSSIVIFPFVMSPFCVSKRPVIALKAVVFPEPLLPRRATISPFGTSNEIPLKTKITSW